MLCRRGFWRCRIASAECVLARGLLPDSCQAGGEPIRKRLVNRHYPRRVGFESIVTRTGLTARSPTVLGTPSARAVA